MTEELTKEQRRALIALYNRRNIARVCIKVASEAPQDDPRRIKAIEEYNRQLLAIDQKIAAITGEIPAVTVGLKPGILFGESKTGG